jgi:hypothetical protein
MKTYARSLLNIDFANVFASDICRDKLVQLLELVGQISDNDAKLAPVLIELQASMRHAARSIAR